MQYPEPAIIIDRLTVKFNGFTAVNDVSLTIKKGEIFGFLGANGAGKTTTIRVLCGLLEANAGWIRIAGKDLSDNRNAIKAIIGYMSQKFTLYEDLTVEENIAFKSALRGLSQGQTRDRRNELLEFIGFTYPLNTLVKNLPSGVKQQVSLAASLLHDPEVIFLDEPTSGVSPLVRARFWELIKELAAKGKTVIVTTHYMDEAEQCERIALMRSGRLIALGSPEELKSQAYKVPLIEISAISRQDIRPLLSSKAITAWWPYGLKFHAVASSAEEAAGFISALPKWAAGKKIKPSLEDVFIKLVEGTER
ncbi:MAG: ABC transporter ATP-binding protein [bacterium]|nr:ABC transporter ATP-binding protein [bacterium]